MGSDDQSGLVRPKSATAQRPHRGQGHEKRKMSLEEKVHAMEEAEDGENKDRESQELQRKKRGEEKDTGGGGAERDQIEAPPTAAGAEASNEDEEEEEEGAEEGRTSTGVASPQQVTAEEREEHNRTHTPFRSWCKYCVMGRGCSKPHKRKTKKQKRDEQQGAVPRVAMDYFFMSQEDEKAKECPVLSACHGQ